MAKGWKLNIQTRLDRFLDNIEIGNGCWNWVGFINEGGYGRYKWNQKNTLAHRLMWSLAFGEFDSSLDVCHTCDNTKCVNPSHLFLGTHTDNMRDMIRKGRAPITPRGDAWYKVYGNRKTTRRVNIG